MIDNKVHLPPVLFQPMETEFSRLLPLATDEGGLHAVGGPCVPF
jgi:hypothetical protein